MAREAISGTWNGIAELWHAKSLKIIYIMFYRDALVYVCENRVPFPVAINCTTFKVARRYTSWIFRFYFEKILCE